MVGSLLHRESSSHVSIVRSIQHWWEWLRGRKLTGVVLPTGGWESSPCLLGGIVSPDTAIELGSLIGGDDTTHVRYRCPRHLTGGIRIHGTGGTSDDPRSSSGGGIERGQTFSVPFPDLATTKVSGMATGAAMVAIPVGHWRDQWYECFSHGLCHPHLWTSCMCTFLATGQVIRRLGLDARGSITNKPAEKATAFPLILTAVIVYFVVHIILAIVAVALDPNSGHEDEPDYMKLPKPKSYYWVMTIYNIWNWTYWIVTTIILMKTRQTVRQMYAIPAAEFEDCFFSVFCHCCVAAQLLRHTTDYNVYPSHCLSDTGLPKHVPSIV